MGNTVYPFSMEPQPPPESSAKPPVEESRRVWKDWTNAQRAIVIAAGLAFISLFMPWIDAVIAKSTGWEELGFIGVAAFAYPVYRVFTGNADKKWLPIALAVFAVLFGALALWGGFVTIEDEYVDPACENPDYRQAYPGMCPPLESETLDFTGSGVYLYLVSSVAFLVGAVMDSRRRKAPTG